MIITATTIIPVSRAEPLKSTKSKASEILVMSAIIKVGKAIAKAGAHTFFDL